MNIINGNCIEEIPKLGKFKFIFADPPFNIGQKYKGYTDKRKDFEQFTENWIKVCWEACDGILALHGPDNLADLYLIAARKFNMKRVAWINWHYRFGQCGRSNWIDSRCHCLIFSKHKKYTWNPESVIVESDRVKYKDKRVNDTVNGGKRLPGTIWGIPSDGSYWGRVQGTSKERRVNHPNQLPELYLERLIKAYTNINDKVLDPFCGSGTTITVATTLKRDCTTIDISKENCLSAKDRVTKGCIRVKG